MIDNFFELVSCRTLSDPLWHIAIVHAIINAPLHTLANACCTPGNKYSKQRTPCSYRNYLPTYWTARCVCFRRAVIADHLIGYKICEWYWLAHPSSYLHPWPSLSYNIKLYQSCTFQAKKESLLLKLLLIRTNSLRFYTHTGHGNEVYFLFLVFSFSSLLPGIAGSSVSTITLSLAIPAVTI